MLSRHQEFLLNELRGRLLFSLEAELEMADDFIDDLRIFDEGDYKHLASEGRTNKRVYLINLVLGPDVNRSYYQFEVEGKSIRMGLTSIKELTLKTAEKVIEERKSGEYLSAEGFLCRVFLTKSELLFLIKSVKIENISGRTDHSCRENPKLIKALKLKIKRSPKITIDINQIPYAESSFPYRG